MDTETAKTSKNNEKIKAIRNLHAQQRRTVALCPSEYRSNATEAIVEWVNSWDTALDVACCWHAAKHIRNQQRGNSETWFQNQLTTYFKAVLAVVYKNIPDRKRPTIARFITLEHTDGVGWHAHGLLSKPAHMSLEEFSKVLREAWGKQMEHCEHDALGGRIFWCEERSSGYLSYILKSASEKDGLRFGELKGLIDLKNTRRP